MRFAAEGLCCGYQHTPVLTGLDFAAESGAVLCILGPNGVGKTTLFKTLMGLLPAMGGDVTVDGTSVLNWPARKKAQLMGFVPQSHIPPFPYTVQQVVVMGRTAHLGIMSAPTEKDYALADQTLEALGIAHLGDKIYTRISGGEMQMALIARALVQEPRILLMDEPAANLDFANQAMVLKTVQSLAARGIIVVMTTHTPDHVFLCGTQVLLLTREREMLSGPPEDIMTPENMRRAYGIDVCITTAEADGQLVRGCVPLMGKSNPVSTAPGAMK
ncbi:MAG: ABC transporter ATP-binding protein [Oscillospiraceae bacterium]|nr:ABC transporter ATP-binding protein [Oscillospiraceae bacterium]